jgi:hypothetical protein
MIFIKEENSPDPSLVPYTGAVYREKSDVLPEYNDAVEEFGSGNVYLVFV